MTDLDLDSIDPRKATPGQVADVIAALREARADLDHFSTEYDAACAEVERLQALVNAKQSWIDGAKVDLDAIEARANAATDGPWGYPFAGKNRITTPVDIDITQADWGGENLREYVLSCLDDRNAWRAADAEFIAHARTDVPALIAYARELEAERDTLLDNLDDERVILGDALRERDEARVALARVTAACGVYRKIAEASPYFGDDLTDEDWAALAGPTPTEGDDRA